MVMHFSDAGEPSQHSLQQVLHIFAYVDRNYLTAGLPVHRLHVHVRKLVNAGYKVQLLSMCSRKQDSIPAALMWHTSLIAWQL